MPCRTPDLRTRALLRRLRIPWIATLGLYFVTSFIPTTHSSPFVQLVVGLVAGCLFTAFVLLTGTIVYLALDEFQRLLLTRSFVWGTVITMSVAAIWGHIEMVAPSRLPHLPLVALPAALIVITSVAKVLLFRTPSPATA